MLFTLHKALFLDRRVFAFASITGAFIIALPTSRQIMKLHIAKEKRRKL